VGSFIVETPHLPLVVLAELDAVELVIPADAAADGLEILRAVGILPPDAEALDGHSALDVLVLLEHGGVLVAADPHHPRFDCAVNGRALLVGNLRIGIGNVVHGPRGRMGYAVGTGHPVRIQAIGLLGGRVDRSGRGGVAERGVLAERRVGAGDVRDPPLTEGEGNTVGDGLDAAIVAHDGTSG
jgi:hypothetical protein